MRKIVLSEIFKSVFFFFGEENLKSIIFIVVFWGATLSN